LITDIQKCKNPGFTAGKMVVMKIVLNFAMVRITSCHQKLGAQLAGEKKLACPLFSFFHPHVAKSTQKYFFSSLSLDLN
jgi:hypothetical protein